MALVAASCGSHPSRPSSSPSSRLRLDRIDADTTRSTMSDGESSSQKMHSGYHGWMKSIPKTGHDFTPARIDAPATATAESSNGGSAWNSAGTWEERDKSEWARERLKELILSSFVFTNDTLSLAVKASSVVRCDGDAKVVFSRGKKRCGYDISLKFEFESTRSDDSEGFPEAIGHVELHDFDDTSGEDYEVKITVEGSTQHAKDAKKAVQQWESGLRKILAEWKSELLQQ